MHGPRRIEVYTDDLSEGGLRCAVDDTVGAYVGDCIGVVLHLGGRELHLSANVIRASRSNASGVERALRFVGLDDDAAADLRRYLFGLWARSMAL